MNPLMTARRPGGTRSVAGQDHHPPSFVRPINVRRPLALAFRDHRWRRRLLLVAAACAVLLLLIGVAEAAEPWRGGHGGCGGTGTGTGTCFTRLFSFGDSITDNGNWMHYARSPGAVARPPYGETFFRRPNGRFCDGRIIIDHIADALGIPFLTPYLAGNKSGDYAHGANFAVGGATALDRGYFRRKKLDARFTPYSLRWQMHWLNKVLAMLSSSSSSSSLSEQRNNNNNTQWSDLMASSLFLLGEIGGNDYNQALFQGRSVDEVKTFVPDVVAAIAAALTELIEIGARTVVVPGNFPTGCNPGYLAEFQTNDTAEYDATGCLRWANDLSELHNRALGAALAEVRRRHPGVAVVYADYYAAAMDITAYPRRRGLGGAPLVPCCGGGGPYNTNLTAHCGAATSTTCRRPYDAVSWDGFHFTDHAYQVIADGVLRGPYASPPVLQLTKCRRRPPP